jgi:pimeloyl-ACP methyl ester carboxylesterase
MINEKEILINNLRINYKIAGEGEPLLILHGWDGSSNSWVDVQKILASQGLKVIVLDLPGFGKSKSPFYPWGVADYSELVLKFINKIGLEKVNLMGHSFGGRIAIKFAVSHPEKLKKLILCASAGVKHPLTLSQLIILKISIVGNFFFSKRPLKRLKDIAQNFFYTFLRHKDYIKAKGVMKETLKKVLEEDLKPELFQIKANTLLIWGEKDKAVPLEDAHLMKKSIPQSFLEIIPGASHTPNLEVPEKVADIVINFLKPHEL